MSTKPKSQRPILERIQDFIPGWVVGDVNDEEGIICNAFNHIIDLCPIDYLAKHTDAWTAIDGDSGTDMDGKKILEVFMVNSDLSNKYTKCKEVNHATFQKASFAGSIYEATKLSPIYHYDASLADNKLKILPSGIAGQATFITYFTPHTLVDALTSSIFDVNNDIPGTLETAMILQACIDLMRAKIASASVSDEDTELMTIYQGNIQSLQTQLDKEMQRITGKKAD
jgi:hypothetical protein